MCGVYITGGGGGAKGHFRLKNKKPTQEKDNEIICQHISTMG